MKNILNFLTEIGKLKDIKRKGITFYGIKKPDNSTSHSFRMALMVWVLRDGKKINLEKAFKMALIHDICKIITGDITPYDGLLPTDKKEKDKFVRSWRRLSLNDKKKRHREKFKKEYGALKKLTLRLPKKLKKEIRDLWLEYHRAKSVESKLVHQINITENLIEALECWRKDEKFPTKPWWEHADEVVDDPVILKFLKEIEKEEKRGNRIEKRKKSKKAKNK